MKVAAYQAPLEACGSTGMMLRLIRERIDWCERRSVRILCCPEAVLGGLADYATSPDDIAIDVERGQLDVVLAPLASDAVATIIGFTEIDRERRLYNAAAVYHRGLVVGLYRKIHPAINRSVYEAGDRHPVFTVGALTFGIMICQDSNDPDLARTLVSEGAAALFVPTNNGLPRARAHAETAAAARRIDVCRAVESGVSVIRADVAGRTERLTSHGSSEIVDRNGTVLGSLPPFHTDVIVAAIETTHLQTTRAER